MIETECSFISKFENGFVIKRRLGNDTPSFANVFLVARKDSCHESSAVKTIKLLSFDKNAEREVNILKSLIHRNIVRFFDSWIEEPPKVFSYQHLSSGGSVYSFIEMEACLEGDLSQWLATNRRSFEEKNDIFRQIVQGVVYIHSLEIIHRDLKPANIFLKTENEKLIAKVGDLGLATFRRPIMTSQRGTEYYQSPEISQKGHNHYCAKTDVYSLGMIYFEMFAGICQEDWEEWKLKMQNVRNNQFPDIFINKNLQNQKKLITLMLHRNPCKRRSSHEVMNWIEGKEYYQDGSVVFGGLNFLYNVVAITICNAPVDYHSLTTLFDTCLYTVETIYLKEVTLLGKSWHVFILPNLKCFYLRFASDFNILPFLSTPENLKSVIFFRTLPSDDLRNNPDNAGCELSDIWELGIDISICTRKVRFLEIKHKSEEFIINLPFEKEFLLSIKNLHISKLSVASRHCNLTDIPHNLSYLNLSDIDFSFERMKLISYQRNLSELYLRNNSTWKIFDLFIIPPNLNVLHLCMFRIFNSSFKIFIKSASFENCTLTENFFSEVLSAKKLAIFYSAENISIFETVWPRYKLTQKTVNGIFRDFSKDDFEWIYIDAILPLAPTELIRRRVDLLFGMEKDEIETILERSNMNIYQERILFEKKTTYWESTTLELAKRNSIHHEMSGCCNFFNIE